MNRNDPWLQKMFLNVTEEAVVKGHFVGKGRQPIRVWYLVYIRFCVSRFGSSCRSGDFCRYAPTGISWLCILGYPTILPDSWLPLMAVFLLPWVSNYSLWRYGLPRRATRSSQWRGDLLAVSAKIGASHHLNYVIANQSADWCGNPFSTTNSNLNHWHQKAPTKVGTFTL